jgi:hypothetical protein
MAVQLTITNCSECPHHRLERYYTADSFEYVCNLLCSKTDRPRPETTDKMKRVENSSRIAFVETGSPAAKAPIPDWCPLRPKKVPACECGCCPFCCDDEDLWK